MIDGLGIITGTGGMTDRILGLAKKHSLAHKRYYIEPMLPQLIDFLRFLHKRQPSTSAHPTGLHPFKFGQIAQQLRADEIKCVYFCGNFPKDRYIQLLITRQLFGTFDNVADLEFRSFHARTSSNLSQPTRYYLSLTALLKTLDITPIFAKDLFPELIAPSGVVTRALPPDSLYAQLPGLLVTLGKQIEFQAAKRLRLTQAAIVDDGVIIDVETTGTDSLLAKFAASSVGRRAPYLLKLPSVDFNPALDQPTIGPTTVANCTRAGLSGIVICSDITTIVDKQLTITELDKAGLFLYGIPLAQLVEIYRSHFDLTWA